MSPAETFLMYFFCLISQLGGQNFYIVIIPWLHWGHDKRLANGTAAMLLTSNWLNTFMKDWFKVPRPSTSKDYPCTEIDTYSFPSGHAQGTASFWTYVYGATRKNWVGVLGIIMIVLVAYSRIYLGVHRPDEVIVGAVLGLLVALAFLGLRGPASRSFERMDHFQRLSLAVAFPVVMFLVTRTVVSAKLTGFLMGVLVGSELESTNLDMPEATSSVMRWRRYIVGYSLCAVLLFGLGYFLPEEPGWQFVVFTLSGMGVTYFAPMAFSRFEDWDKMRNAVKAGSKARAKGS